MNIRKITLCVIAAALWCSVVSAQSFSGRLFSSVYTWEREIFGVSQQKNIQAYNGAVLHVNGISGRDISFHTYARLSNTFGDADFEAKNKLYNAYFEWKNIADKFDLSVGRHFIWAGVGNGTIDGAKVEYNLKKWGKAGIYAGSLTPLRESWKVDSWAESHMIGAFYKARLYDTDMQVSWVKKDRDPVEYAMPGRYSERIISTSGLRANLAGIDVAKSITDKVRLYLKTEASLYDNGDSFLPKTIELDRFEVSSDYTPMQKLTVSAQYFYRNPHQNLNSIFSVFSQSSNQEFWVNVYYRPLLNYTVYGGWALVKMENDETNRFNIGFSSLYFSVGGQKFSGYSGEYDNMYLSSQYPVFENIWLKGSISAGRYKLYDTAADYNNLVTSSAGLTYKPRPSITFDIEGQGVRNEINKTDYRLFGRFNYWFFYRNTNR
ncbi:hypothetical protein ACFL67_02120 [candidate division KSB1 bacterium]